MIHHSPIRTRSRTAAMEQQSSPDVFGQQLEISDSSDVTVIPTTASSDISPGASGRVPTGGIASQRRDEVQHNIEDRIESATDSNNRQQSSQGINKVDVLNPSYNYSFPQTSLQANEFNRNHYFNYNVPHATENRNLNSQIVQQISSSISTANATSVANNPNRNYLYNVNAPHAFVTNRNFSNNVISDNNYQQNFYRHQMPQVSAAAATSVNNNVMYNASSLQNNNAASTWVMPQNLNYLNLDITKYVPIFDGDVENIHPVIFVEKLEYVINAFNLDIKHIGIWGNALFKGPAQIWANTMLRSVNDIQSFKESFLNYFFNDFTQIKIRSEIENGRYDINMGGYVPYFMKHVNKAQFLMPPLAESMLITLIAKHFPHRVAATLIGASKINEAIIRLQQAEHIFDSSFKNFRVAANQERSQPNPQIHGRREGSGMPKLNLRAIDIASENEGVDQDEPEN